MDIYKKLNLILVVVTALVAFGLWEYWKNFCGIHECTLYQMDWVMRPLLWGSAAWALITGTLLFFPSHVFKKWLMHIGWWGALLSVTYVLSVDPRSSNILSPDRGQAAWFAGCVVALISALYLIGWYILAKWRYGTTPAPLSRLLALILAAAIFYYLQLM